MCHPIASRVASSMSGKREDKDVPAPGLDVDGGTNTSEACGRFVS